MPTFYCLYNSIETSSQEQSDRLLSLRRSCEKSGILFYSIDEASADFTSLPVPTAEDALYNCARGSYLLESVLINRNVRTFYREYPFFSQKDDSNFICIQLEKQNISTPKSIYKGTNDKNLLKNYVDFLGGFPVIIKTYGGTGGIGVIKVDSYSSLFSIADYYAGIKVDFQIKEFIESESCERVTVLGNEVLYSISRPILENDFRSDGYSNRAKKTILSKEINNMAIKATHAANYNYAGVDIIISSRDHKPYILEVNCPHNFARHEQITGENYSEKMIRWLFN